MVKKQERTFRAFMCSLNNKTHNANNNNNHNKEMNKQIIFFIFQGIISLCETIDQSFIMFQRVISLCESHWDNKK